MVVCSSGWWCGELDGVDYWIVWSSGWLCGVVDGGME